MKWRTIALVALSMSVTLIVSASALPPGPSHLSLYAKQESRLGTAVNNTTTYGLYSNSYRGRIGTEVIICGTRPTWKICLAFLRTPRGTLVAQGIVPKYSKYIVLGILGGTGIYANSGGSLTLHDNGNGTQTISGNLDSF